MDKIDPTFIGFLIVCVTGLSGFVVWLVKNIIRLTRDCTETMKDVRNAVYNNTQAVRDNSEAIKELQTTILTINK